MISTQLDQVHTDHCAVQPHTKALSSITWIQESL